MSSAQARAVRPRSQPMSTGSPENPYPGREGSTRWKASSALPPCAVGSVSGPTVSIIDYGAGPAVGHDQRQRVVVRRLDVDEVDVDAINLSNELRKRVQARLDPPEVVHGPPVAGERLQGFELDPL